MQKLYVYIHLINVCLSHLQKKTMHTELQVLTDRLTDLPTDAMVIVRINLKTILTFESNIKLFHTSLSHSPHNRQTPQSSILVRLHQLLILVTSNKTQHYIV